MSGVEQLIQAIHRLETEAYQHGMRNGSANGTAIYREGRGGPDAGAPHQAARDEVVNCLMRLAALEQPV